jgi:nucleoside-diphosphate-sugar epimerase
MRADVDPAGPVRRSSTSQGAGLSRLDEEDPPTDDGRGHTSWVHLADAVDATIMAIEREVAGVFNIVDDEPAPVSEWLPYLARCAGARPPRRIPAWLGRRLAGDMVVGMMLEGRGFCNAKAKRELGWTPQFSSWREGFKEELACPVDRELP